MTPDAFSRLRDLALLLAGALLMWWGCSAHAADLVPPTTGEYALISEWPEWAVEVCFYRPQVLEQVRTCITEPVPQDVSGRVVWMGLEYYGQLASSRRVAVAVMRLEPGAVLVAEARRADGYAAVSADRFVVPGTPEPPPPPGAPLIPGLQTLTQGAGAILRWVVPAGEEKQP